MNFMVFQLFSKSLPSRFPGALGPPVESLGDPLRTPWGPPGIPWGPLGDPLGPLGDLLGTLVDHLGTFGDVLGRLGHALAIPCGPLTSAFGYFRCLLGTFWGQLGAPKAFHRPPKGSRETTLGHLGSIVDASTAFTKRFAATCKNHQIYCKVLQKSRSGDTESFENLFQVHQNQ